MSVPYLSFSCSSCDYRETSFVASGRFSWVYEGKMFNFFPNIGICLDCQKIVPIEGIPAQDVFLRARALHPKIKGKMSSLIQRDEAKWLAYQEDFHILEIIVDQNRRPVCLQCGRENCEKIDLASIGKGNKLTDIDLTSIGIKHPGCDGELFMKGSGSTRIGITPKAHYFDIRGQYLTTLHGREGHSSF